MLKKEIYPKTERIDECESISVTEKLDGSNLCIFKYNGEIYLAQRKNIFKLSELEEAKSILYKGLYEWLNANGDALKQELIEGSMICGEWIGMGQIKYNVDEFDKRFYMFAKANFDENFNLENIKYNHDEFIYPFESQTIPYFIGVVPEIARLTVIPNKNHLDSLYEKYTKKVDRIVEGFVINYKNIISKYVRIKNGKLVDYHKDDHKGKIENESDEEK